jgi:hypothetical protein
MSDLQTHRVCTNCKEDKQAFEFGVDPRSVKPGRQPRLKSWCRKCENTAVKPFSDTKLIRNRARTRAIALLVQENQDRLNQLIEDILPIVRQEALAVSDEAHGVARLKPGPKRPDEQVIDRVDVARCRHCANSHDRDHECEFCGRKPGDDPLPIQPATRLPSATRFIKVVDPDEVKLKLRGHSPAQVAASLGLEPNMLAVQLAALGHPALAARFTTRRTG